MDRRSVSATRQPAASSIPRRPESDAASNAHRTASPPDDRCFAALVPTIQAQHADDGLAGADHGAGVRTRPPYRRAPPRNPRVAQRLRKFAGTAKRTLRILDDVLPSHCLQITLLSDRKKPRPGESEPAAAGIGFVRCAEKRLDWPTIPAIVPQLFFVRRNSSPIVGLTVHMARKSPQQPSLALQLIEP
jgi:hypothetical protein